MFNSVAKYLWGSVENEGDYTDDRPEQGPIVQETPIPDDGDWVLVDTVDNTTTTTTLGAGQASEDVATREGDGALSPAASQSQPHRPHHHHHLRPHSQAALHTIQLSPERLLEKSRLAQRHQLSQKDKVVSNQHCRRQNLVRAFSSASKRSNNRRNKLMRPSGCKSSRNSQRVH